MQTRRIECPICSSYGGTSNIFTVASPLLGTRGLPKGDVVSDIGRFYPCSMGRMDEETYQRMDRAGCICGSPFPAVLLLILNATEPFV